MNEIAFAFISCVVLFAGMVLFSKLGERLNRGTPPDNSSGSAVCGAVFALLGLLLAFTYSGAFQRFDRRRELMVEELSAIEIAYARVKLLPTGAQAATRERFRTYVASRIACYHAPDDKALVTAYAETGHLGNEIWLNVITDAGTLDTGTRNFILLSLNEMFHAAERRHASTLSHHPVLILLALYGVALVAAGLAGYCFTGDHRRHRVQMITFAVVVSLSVYIIIDLDYPRDGLIRLDQINGMFDTLHDSMK